MRSKPTKPTHLGAVFTLYTPFEYKQVSPTILSVGGDFSLMSTGHMHRFSHFGRLLGPNVLNRYASAQDLANLARQFICIERFLDERTSRAENAEIDGGIFCISGHIENF
jgi:hypothetical protein